MSFPRKRESPVFEGDPRLKHAGMTNHRDSFLFQIVTPQMRTRPKPSPTNLTHAFVQLFGLNDYDTNGRYEQTFARAVQETGEVPSALYRDLDVIDGKEGNGFTENDVKTFMQKFGLDALQKKYYPFYSFQYRERCQCIHITAFENTLEGNVPFDDKHVAKTLRRIGLEQNELKSLNVLIPAVSYQPDKPQLIAIEDVHGNPKHGALIYNLASRFAEKRRQLVILFEEARGPIRYDVREARKDWDIIQYIILNTWYKDPNRVPNGETTEGRAIRIAIRARMQARDISQTTIKSLTVEQLKDFFIAHPEFKTMILAISPSLVLFCDYGNQLLIANSESEIPLNFKVPSEKGDHRTPDMPEMNTLLQAKDATFRDPAVKQNPVLASKLVLRDPLLTLVKEVDRASQERTRRWATNVLSLAQDEASCGKSSECIVILFGGASHFPLLKDELDGKISLMFLRPAN